jgi:hypothetical protein
VLPDAIDRSLEAGGIVPDDIPFGHGQDVERSMIRVFRWPVDSAGLFPAIHHMPGVGRYLSAKPPLP